MKNEVLIALAHSLISEAIASHESNHQLLQGERGPRGIKGEKGESFHFEDHKAEIQGIISSFIDSSKAELKLKFSDLSEEDKALLIGPSGKDFSFEENKENISALVEDFVSSIRDGLKLRFQDLTNEDKDSLKLKFSDLTEDEKFTLRGSRGQRGKAGRDFNYEDHAEHIHSVITDIFLSFKDDLKLKFTDLSDGDKDLLKLKFSDLTDGDKDSLKLKFEDLSEDNRGALKLKFSDLTDEEKTSLKLKFEDLSEDEKFSLRGSRGQKGKAGRDFEFNEHKERISDLIFDNREDLKLKFEDLTEDERDSLKLRFDHLTDQEKKSLKGIDGKDGKTVMGPPGLQGLRGEKGESAPRVIEVELIKKRNNISFQFSMDDGEVFETNFVELPKLQEIVREQVVFMQSQSGSTSDRASKLAFDKILGEDIEAFKIVSLVDANTIFKSDMNTRPVSHGIITESGVMGATKTVIMFGIIESPIFTFPINKKLFLGLNGTIIDTMPTGAYYVVVGKSLGAGAIFVDIKEPEAL
jgi:hypothetical protein